MIGGERRARDTLGRTSSAYWAYFATELTRVTLRPMTIRSHPTRFSGHQEATYAPTVAHSIATFANGRYSHRPTLSPLGCQHGKR
jgi:hypothetical protein